MADKLNKNDSSSNSFAEKKEFENYPGSFSPLSLSASRKIFKDIQR